MENQRYQIAVEVSEVTNRNSILDLGSSYGTLLNYLPKNISYIGIDWNSQIDNHHHYLKTSHHHINHNLELGLPEEVKKKKFDVIFILGTLNYLQNYRTLLFECREVLNPHGRIIISVPNQRRYIRIPEDNIYQTHSKVNLINLANLLDMKYHIQGTQVRIPKLNWFFKSKQMIYNEETLMVLSL